MEQIPNTRLSSDCFLQLENMKVESLVIVDQHATVNLYLSLVHTARHIMGAGLAQRVACVVYAIKHVDYPSMCIFHVFQTCKCLVQKERDWCSDARYFTVGTVTDMKS